MVWNIGYKIFYVGDGMVVDFDLVYKGLECFVSEDCKGGSIDKYLFLVDGKFLGKNEEVFFCCNWVWWDGDLLCEIFKGDDNWWGVSFFLNGCLLSIVKWKGEILI